MSVEALWTAQFEVAGGWVNGGVVVLETGRIFGGDSQFYYLGTYNLAGSTVTGQVRSRHYHGERNTAWGDNADIVDLTVQGALTGDVITGQVTRLGFPPLRFQMTKRSDLP